MGELSNKSVRFNSVTAERFEKVALKLGRHKRLVFQQMVEYFYRSRKDPLDINDELLKNTLLRSHEDYIGFIRTQEAELLIPIKGIVDRLFKSQQVLLDYFNVHVMSRGQQTFELLDSQSKGLAGIEKGLGYLVNRLDENERLKEKFINILKGYAAAREQFGLMTPKAEKDALFGETVSMIKNL